MHFIKKIFGIKILQVKKVLHKKVPKTGVTNSSLFTGYAPAEAPGNKIAVELQMDIVHQIATAWKRIIFNYYF